MSPPRTARSATVKSSDLISYFVAGFEWGIRNQMQNSFVACLIGCHLPGCASCDPSPHSVFGRPLDDGGASHRPSPAQTAATKYQRLSGLNNKNVFPHSGGGLEVQFSPWWRLFSWLADGHLTVSSHGRESAHKISGVSYKDANHIGSGPPPLWPHLNLITSWLQIVTMG